MRSRCCFAAGYQQQSAAFRWCRGLGADLLRINTVSKGLWG